jgi:hypothetical protein
MHIDVLIDQVIMKAVISDPNGDRICKDLQKSLVKAPLSFVEGSKDLVPGDVLT